MGNEVITEIGLYYSCVIIVIGTVGNVLSFLVFHKAKSCKASRCSIYFKCLALVDLYVLYFPCMELLLYCLPTSVSYRTIHVVLCKIAAFNVLFAVEVSTWITVAVTVERTITVCFPFKFQKQYVRKWMYVKVVTIALILAGINSYKLVIYDLIWSRNVKDVYASGFPKNQKYCGTKASFDAMVDIWNMTILNFVLPLLLNGTCNVILMRKLYSRAEHSAEVGVTGHRAEGLYSDAHHVTYRVLAICFVNFLSSAPISMVQFYIYMFQVQLSDTLVNVYMACNCIWYTNSAANVFLYGLTGRDFRQGLKSLFCKTRSQYTSRSTNNARVRKA